MFWSAPATQHHQFRMPPRQSRAAGSTKAVAAARREEQRIQKLHAKERAAEKREARSSKKLAKREAREAKAEQAREAAHADDAGQNSGGSESEVEEYTGEKPGHAFERASLKGQVLHAAREMRVEQQLSFRLASLVRLQQHQCTQTQPNAALQQFLESYLGLQPLPLRSSASSNAAVSKDDDAEWNDENEKHQSDPATHFTLAEEISGILERHWSKSLPRSDSHDDHLMSKVESQKTQDLVHGLQRSLDSILLRLRSNTLHVGTQEVLQAAQLEQLDEDVIQRWDSRARYATSF